MTCSTHLTPVADLPPAEVLISALGAVPVRRLPCARCIALIIASARCHVLLLYCPLHLHLFIVVVPEPPTALLVTCNIQINTMSATAVASELSTYRFATDHMLHNEALLHHRLVPVCHKAKATRGAIWLSQYLHSNMRCRASQRSPFDATNCSSGWMWVTVHSWPACKSDASSTVCTHHRVLNVPKLCKVRPELVLAKLTLHIMAAHSCRMCCCVTQTFCLCMLIIASPCRQQTSCE